MHKLYIWNGVVESHQIRVRTPSSHLLAAERLGSPYSASICACENRAKKNWITVFWNFFLPLELSVGFFWLYFFGGVSSRVNPCDIKVVFSSEISVLRTPNTDTITRGGGGRSQCPKKVEIVAFHCQRMVRCSFPPVTEILRGNIRRRVLEHIMRKLRSVLEGNRGKLGSAVMTVTPVSEAGK